MRFDVVTMGLVAVLTAVVGTGASAEEIDRHFEKSFEVREGARLVLEHGDGDVVLGTASGDTIDVEIRYRADMKSGGAGVKTDFEVDFEQTGDTVRIVGREPKFRGLGFSGLRVREYVYEITAPDWVALELDGSDGDVEISGRRAPVEIELSDGDVELRDTVASRVRLHVSDGDVEIDGLEAELEFKASDGDLEMSDSRLSSATLRLSDGDVVLRDCSGSFELRTSDGNLTADRLVAGRVRIETSDGDVSLDLAESPDLDLEIKTSDGTVEIDHAPRLSATFEVYTRDGVLRIDTPTTIEMTGGRRSARGELGSGSGRIKVTTGDGSVTLREGS